MERGLASPRLILGCGYLGSRVAQVWLSHQHRVMALTRGRVEVLAQHGIEPLRGDVLDPKSLRLPPTQTTLYAVGLDRSAGRSMRDVYVQGVRNVLNQLPPSGRFLYVSSTSVYGQTDGSWVTEDSPTTPTEESGQVVLEAEEVVRTLRPDAILLRFAGIYGPGRILRKLALERGEPLIGDADKWLNLIQVDDGVQAILAAEARGTPGTTYLIADDTPVRRRELYTETALLLGFPPAQFEHRDGHEPNRRIANTRARAELGWAPQYPSYREGLRASVV